MKKKALIIIIIIFFFTDATVSYAKRKIILKKESDNSEMRIIYISYLEYLKYFNGKSKVINQTMIDKMIDNMIMSVFVAA